MKITVFGLGISAVGVLEFLKNCDHQTTVVNQGRVDSWRDQVLVVSDRFTLCAQDDSKKTFIDSDLIILSPGIPRSHPCLVEAIKQGTPIQSEIEFTFNHSEVPVIGITGSNGKTTTATMTADILKRLGKRVFLGGNIGHAYSNILTDKDEYDYAVIEVSSFQLESVKKFRPLVSIITNITPNHMERYSSFDKYKEAKLNLLANQLDGELVIAAEDINTLNQRKIEIKKLSGFDFKNTALVGDHNRLNFFCAHAVARELCSAYTDESFQVFIDEFNPVAHRLEFRGEFKGLKFYNDSKSTNIEATLSALRSFDHLDDLVLILGGKLREESVDEFEALNQYQFSEILVFGESKELLSKLLDCSAFDELQGAFDKIKTLKNKTILFSPGFPSFDQFQNFEKRGERFNELVSLFKESN